MPLVSVIIPAYNSGHYLDEAVRSVIAQTFADWECIVVDDGSTEDLSRVEKMDPRVRLIRQPNRGTSAARNNGILSSTGGLIAFLDHDDLWLPEKLERQVGAFRSSDSTGYCYTAFNIIDHASLPVGAGWASGYAGYAEMLALPGRSLLSSTMIRRECLWTAGLFDPLYPASQDYDLALKIARDWGISYIPEPLALYRYHPNNFSRNYSAMLEEAIHVLDKHLLLARRRGDRAVIAAISQARCLHRRNFAAQAYNAARLCVRRHEFERAVPHLLRSLKWHPAGTVSSLAKFPMQRTAEILRGARAGRPETRRRERQSIGGPGTAGEAPQGPPRVVGVTEVPGPLSRAKTLFRRGFPRAYLLARHALHRGGDPVQRVVERKFWMRVAGGPFAGMLYLPQAAGSVIVAKLVGTYESELHGAVFDALARGYETVVDVGCAEGYYAVGFARCLREAQVITYDIDPMARRLCDALARANGVRGRVAIRCECTPARLIEVRQRRGLAILDCEGYEADLINDDVAAGLAGWDFLIEAHETERPGVTEVLSSRLAPTHTLAVIDVQTKRPEDFRAVMALPEGMRAAALDEGRVGLQRWIWAKSRLRS